MPAAREIKTSDYHLLLWEITEDYQFFAKDLSLSFTESQELALIAKDARKLEWMAARFVQRQLIKESLIKGDFGKPYLTHDKGFISISHCKGYAAAIFSKSKACGIDIEPIHDKVLRIADKFLKDDEKTLCTKDNLAQDYIAAWSVKETVYKWFGKKNLNFKEHLHLHNLSIQNGKALVELRKNNTPEDLNILLEKHGEIIMTYLAH